MDFLAIWYGVARHCVRMHTYLGRHIMKGSRDGMESVEENVIFLGGLAQRAEYSYYIECVEET